MMLKHKSKGSYTVEYSFVMPVVILCLFLIVIMNLYLHDETVLDSIATTAVYSGMEKGEMLDYMEQISGSRRLFLPKPDYACEESMVEKGASWSCSFSLPMAELFRELVKETRVTLDGGCKRYPWNMAQVLRIKSIVES